MSGSGQEAMAAPVGDDGGAAADLDAEPPAADGGGSADAWRKTLEKIVPSVVQIKVTQTRAFDTEAAGSSYATGFVVDAALGLILTNRHVVTTGPVVAEAVFSTREETPVLPVYADPVHDFGFFRYDPAALSFTSPPAIPLAPHAAAVGAGIRVVGNDSGERISILSGTLARLDRDAPHYSRDGYNDFNTFYIAAASGTKGGSSGSPVVDVRGRAVALNAGGKTRASASAFYLPLERVVRALALVRATAAPAGGAPVSPLRAAAWRPPAVPRGDLQATFGFKGFDEARRLGLRRETEAAVRAAAAGAAAAGGDDDLAAPRPRAAAATGVLALDSVVPGGPAERAGLRPGDVLVRLQGCVVADFLPLEDALDAAVGAEVLVEVERGGAPLAATVEVQDLWAVTPSEFLQAAGASIHALSYQQARNHRAEVGQVYVAEPGDLLARAGVPRHAIVTALCGRPTPDLAAFVAALAGAPAGGAPRVPVEYFVFGSRHRRRTALVHLACLEWYGPPVVWARDAAAGVWNATPVALAAPPARPLAAAAAEDDGEEEEALAAAAAEAEAAAASAAGATPEAAARAAREACLRASLVSIEVDIPLVALADGVHARSYFGCGVIVHLDDAVGLVAADRNTVVVSPCNVALSFGAYPCEAPARVRFLHPTHNFALLSFEPAALPARARAAARAAALAPGAPPARGDAVELASLSRSMRLLRLATRVAAVSFADVRPADVPRFRATGGEVVRLEQDLGAAHAGVLADPAPGGAPGGEVRVRALWASFAEQSGKQEVEWMAGVPAAAVAPWAARVLAAVRAGAPPPRVALLGAELEPLLLAKAAQLGLPQAWLLRLLALDPERRQALRVRRRAAGAPARAALADGDVVLAVGGAPVASHAGLEAALDALAWGTEGEGGGGAASRGDGGGASAAKRARASPPEAALTVFRGGAVLDARVPLALEDGLGTTRRLVHWAGAQFQAPHLGVRELGGGPPGAGAGGLNHLGVWCSRWHHGSPAHRFGLHALQYVAEVGGAPTPDLDAFVAAVAALPDGAEARLRLVHHESGRERVLTLKTDLRYWPTSELRLDAAAGAWRRAEVPAAAAAGGGGA